MKNLSKRDYSILIGNVVDHFDTALYGFLAPIFAGLFFPNTDPMISLILAYSVFATTIFTRPLGSYIFGIMALTHSPATSLSYSLIGVGITTCILGFLPTYEQTGILAPVLLIIFRSLGGIFSSGEITIARLYILSDKTNQDALKNSYLYQTSSMMGIVLASFVSTIAFANQGVAYWRVCFIVGGVTALFGYTLRIYKTGKLSLNTRQMLALYSAGGVETLWNNKILLLRIAIISGFSYLTYSVPFIIMNNLVPQFTLLTLEDMTPSNTLLLVMDTILLPIIGSLLTKFETKKTLLYSTTFLAITITPMWWLIDNASFLYIMFIKIWIIIIGIAFSCPVNLWFNNLVLKPEKYLIIGIGSAIGSAFIGKMAPAICLGLYYYTNSSMAVGLFIMAVSLSTIWAILGLGKP